MASNNRQTHRQYSGSRAFIPYGNGSRIANNSAPLPANPSAFQRDPFGQYYGYQPTIDQMPGEMLLPQNVVGVRQLPPRPESIPVPPMPVANVRQRNSTPGLVEAPTDQSGRRNIGVSFSERPSVAISPTAGGREAGGWTDASGTYWPDTTTTTQPSFGSKLFRTLLKTGVGIGGNMLAPGLGMTAKLIPNSKAKVTHQTQGPDVSEWAGYGVRGPMQRSRNTGKKEPILRAEPVNPRQTIPTAAPVNTLANVYGRGIGLGGVTSTGNWNSGVKHSGLNSPVRDYAGPVNHAVTPDHRGIDPFMADADGNPISTPSEGDAMHHIVAGAMAQDPERYWNSKQVQTLLKTNKRLGYDTSYRPASRGRGSEGNLGFSYGDTGPVSDATRRFKDILDNYRKRRGG